MSTPGFMGTMHDRTAVDASHEPSPSGSAGILAGRCTPRCDSRTGKDTGAWSLDVFCCGCVRPSSLPSSLPLSPPCPKPGTTSTKVATKARRPRQGRRIVALRGTRKCPNFSCRQACRRSRVSLAFSSRARTGGFRNGAHLGLFGAQTILSASVLSPGAERTRASAPQPEAKPASERPEMRPPWRVWAERFDSGHPQRVFLKRARSTGQL
jgi:hypothetical protein